uniref:Uncharacterized protein n=1 Tax=Zea mays TaxID=4577 RepID=B4FVV8_MAIZE|nr:unknown [Zea mays]ACF86269.1 unknown [Zea mays]
MMLMPRTVRKFCVQKRTVKPPRGLWMLKRTRLEERLKQRMNLCLTMPCLNPTTLIVGALTHLNQEQKKMWRLMMRRNLRLL